jgi:hypothetical protein
MSRFPLRPSSDGRTLVDAQGHPFLYQADTAWMLPQSLDLREGVELMKARKAQGFNAIQMQMTGFVGMKDLEDRLPFGPNHRFDEPNEGFFNHLDQVFSEAGDLGLQIFISPLWSGCCGEGWAGVDENGSPKPLDAQGVDAAYSLGIWLGERFAAYDHVGWILGGDNDPLTAREEIKALGKGLKVASPRQLTTYHAASTHSSTDVYPNEDWLDVSMVYTYFRGFNKAWNKVQPDVYEVCLLERLKHPRMPFFLGESTYEGEHDDWGSAHQVRKQAYWSMLSGATGHAYGSDNWRTHPHWRDLIQKPGAISLGHLPKVFEDLEWWGLEPDGGDWLADVGTGWARNDHAVGAFSPDASRGAVYVPSPRPITLTERADGLRARWWDPVSASAVPAAAQASSVGPSYAPPGSNDGGDPDWMLILERP